MALAATNVDTMFGAVQFNQFRRNIKKDPVTTQVTSGVVLKWARARSHVNVRPRHPAAASAR
jgi:hypothetical protein